MFSTFGWRLNAYYRDLTLLLINVQQFGFGLNLSAAFDTVDHQILSERLSLTFGGGFILSKWLGGLSKYFFIVHKNRCTCTLFEIQKTVFED